MRQMYSWYDAHGFAANGLTLRAIFGREPRQLRTYIAELAAEHT